MNKTVAMLILILTMAGTTYVIRSVPFVIFKKKINSTFIKSLLFYIPYAVLSAMTFPYIFYSTGNIYAATVATAIALIAAVFKMSLIVVALLACAAALIMILIL